MGTMHINLRSRSSAGVGPAGPARVGQQLDELFDRLRPGDVAVLDRVDLDVTAAETLIRHRVAAVVNAAPSLSGRYPSGGPSLLLAAGVPLVDTAGTGVLTTIRDGDPIRIVEGDVLRADSVVARGQRQSVHSMGEAVQRATLGLVTHLETAAATVPQLLRRHRDTLLDGAGIPELATRLAGRVVVVVSDTPRAGDELTRLRRPLRGRRQVFVGVESGAQTLHVHGRRPDVVIGRPEALTGGVAGDLHALRTVRDVVLLTAEDGTEPAGPELGRPVVTMPLTGTPADAAVLLAAHHGAGAIVTVGGPGGRFQAYDVDPVTLASAVLTGLQVGARLVPAAAVPAVQRRTGPVRRLVTGILLVLLLLGAAVGATVAANHGPPALRALIRSVDHGLQAGWTTARGWLPGG